MRKILQGSIALLALMAAVPTVAVAQQVEPQLDVTSATAPARHKAPAKEMELTSNQMWYGYYKGTEPIVGMGVPSPGIINEMIYINAADPIIKGKTIKAVRFRVQGTSDLSDFSVWLAPQMPYPASEGHIVTVEVDTKELRDTLWNEVLLPDGGYVVPDTGVYVGYSFYTAATTRQSTYPVMTTNDRIAPEGCMYDWEEAFMSGWQWYPGGQMGKLCIQVLLEGAFHENAATVGPLGDHIVVAGGSVDVTIELTNNGNAGISSFDYVVRTGEASTDEQHVELTEPFSILGGKTEATITLQADADYARADKQLVITRVNGQPNEQMDEAVADGTLITLAQASPRRTLIEEYTGTWCGYCPRGTVGLELLNEEFGDDIAIVSIHTDDPMTILGYQPMYENVRDYPSAYFNREYGVDPYAGTLREARGSRYDVLWQQSQPTEASLDVEARWSNDQQTRIAVTSRMRFQYESAKAPYGLAYVLVEDGLQCDTTGWEQRNFYYYFKDQDDYKPGTLMGDDFKDYLNVDTEYMQGVVYNDVAVAAYGITEGLANSVKAPLVIGEEKTHNYTISVGLNNLIQDKSRLRVVAFIIDRKSGRVVNAAVADVHSETDGIEAVPADVAGHEGQARIYDLQGRPVVGRQSSGALRIVRQADGRVVKTLARP